MPRRWAHGGGLAGALLAVLTAAAAVVIFLPASLWGHPDADFRREGLDPRLVVTAPSSATVRDPLAFIDAATGLPCPCPPGSIVTALGSLQDVARSGAVTLTVDGRKVEPIAISPSHITFRVPDHAEWGSATVEVGDGAGEAVRDVLPVGTAGGRVAVGREGVEMEARDGAEPAAYLLTTPLPFVVETEVTVMEAQADADPAWIVIWDPRSSALAGIALRASGSLEAVVSDGPGLSWTSTPLEWWRPGMPVRVRVERTADGAIVLGVWTPDGAVSHRLERSQIPLLSRAFRPSLAMVSLPRHGFARTLVSRWVVVLPHHPFITERIAARGGHIAAVVSGLLLAAIVVTLARSGSAARPLSACPRRLLLGAAAGGAVVAAAVVVPAWALLSGRASHPFDMEAQVVWTRLLATRPLGDLYYASQATPIARPWGGVPYHEAVFPYGIAMAYWFRAIAAATQVVPIGWEVDWPWVEWAIKAANGLAAMGCGALAAALVLVISKRRGAAPLVCAAIVAASPAAIADGALWGETEHVVLLPLLGSVLMFATGHTGVAWSMLAVAAMSKQTVAPAAALLAALYVANSPPAVTLRGVAIGLATALALVLPFCLQGYPPSLAWQPIWSVATQHGGTGIERAFQTVALDLPNLWSLVVPLAAGARGLGRLSFPDYTPLMGGITAHDAGIVLTAAFVVAVAIGTLISPRRSDPSLWLAAAAAVWAGGLFLMTGSLARYLLLPATAAVTVALGRRSLVVGAAVILLAGAATVTITGSLLTALARVPGAHMVSLPGGGSMAATYRSDVFVTAVAVALGIGSALLVAHVMGPLAIHRLTAPVSRCCKPPLPFDRFGKAVRRLYYGDDAR